MPAVKQLLDLAFSARSAVGMIGRAICRGVPSESSMAGIKNSKAQES